MSKAGAAFTVRFLKNGDQIYIDQNIIHENGTGAALFQAINPTSGEVVPDWSVAANQPIIDISARSAAGFPVDTTSVLWAFDGTNLQYDEITTSWQVEKTGKPFSARKTAVGSYQLRITNNIASAEEVGNKQISYSVSYVSNAVSDTYRSSVDIIIQQSGSSSHIVIITTDRTTIKEDDASTQAREDEAHLTAECYYGTSPVTIGQGGYTLQWYQDGTKMEGKTSSVLTVTRSMVDGGSIFVAKLSLNGELVAQDAQRINDIADEWQIAYTPTNSGSNYVTIDHNASFNISLTKNGTAQSLEGVTLTSKVFNALGVEKAVLSGSPITITPAYCQIGDGENVAYADCDVQVTASF
ncbi:MAG: hypothetical protein HUK08_00415 [Bacteroidaceae bacterium]|nr:hypothetical protein [Bacteroidaceae bacterium]